MNYTYDINQFLGMITEHGSRKNIISEGDSWFGYPGNNFVMGHGSNIVDFIAKTEQFNVLRLESNGDEASSMMSNQQRHQLVEIIKLLKAKNYDLHYILFSAGGNDIVGNDDLPFFLNTHTNGMSANECVKWDHLNIRITQIVSAYAELIAIRDELSPNTVIETHGYDYIVPSGIQAAFFGKLFKTGPWIKPYLDEKGIPVDLHIKIVKLIMDSLNKALDDLQNIKANFHKIELRGLLQPDEWLNEIHPTPAGFQKLAAKFLPLLA